MKRLRIEDFLSNNMNLALVVQAVYSRNFKAFITDGLLNPHRNLSSTVIECPNRILGGVLESFDELTGFNSLQILGTNEKLNHEVNTLLLNGKFFEPNHYLSTYVAFYVTQIENYRNFIFELGFHPNAISSYRQSTKKELSEDEKIIMQKSSVKGFYDAYHQKDSNIITNGFILVS